MLIRQILESQEDISAAEIDHWKNVATYLKQKLEVTEKENDLLGKQIKEVRARVEKLSSENLNLQAKCVNKVTKNGRVYFSNFSDLSGRQQDRIKARFRKSLSSSESFMSTYGLKIEEIRMAPANGVDEQFVIKFDNQHRKDEFLYVKDSLNISDYAYTCIRRNIAPEWPSKNQIIKLRGELNEQIQADIHCHPKGYYTSLKNIIIAKINDYEVKTNSCQNKYSIKTAADSTNVSSKLKILNVTLTLVDDELNCISEHGHQIIGNTEAS
jgi:hypothetical protein